GDLLQRRLVLRLELDVALERGRSPVGLLVRLELRREGPPGCRVLRVLLRLLLQRGERAAAARAGEQALHRIGDPGRAGPDADDDEAPREHEGEEDEHPLRVAAQAAGEELILPALVLDPLRLGRRLGYASIRRRAALAMLRTSGHASSPCR